MDKIIQEYNPEMIVGSSYIVNQAIIHEFDLMSINAGGQAVIGSRDPGSAKQQLLDYESSDDGDSVRGDDQQEEASGSGIKYVRKSANPSVTGGYPRHCPIVSCKKRCPDSHKTMVHWKAKMHDGERGHPIDTTARQLLTAADFCAKSDRNDPTFCANCKLEQEIDERTGRKRKSLKNAEQR